MNSYNEDEILECLNQKPDVHGLLCSAIELIGNSVDFLIMKVFRKEKHATKFVIPSLVGKTGPLNDLSIKLKLLYVLGIITREEYEDIELLMAILDELENDEHVYTFVDDEIIGPLSLLHDMVLPLNLPLKKQQNSNVSIIQTAGIVESMQSSLYKQRYQQVIRAALIIAITTLISRISEKQLLDYFPERIPD